MASAGPDTLKMTLKERLKKWSISSTSSQPAVTHNKEDADLPKTAQVTSESRRDGLYLLNGTENYSEESETSYAVDVVFVHGLNGDFLRTWTHKNGVCWPRDLLPFALPGARIYSYGYPAQIIAAKSVAIIHDFASHLLDDLEVAGQQHRPIIFVCHSLGGIVVKQALITASTRKQSHDLLSRCIAVVFMGTPHRGSPYAAHGKMLGDVVNAIMQMSFTDRLSGRVRTDLVKILHEQNTDLLAISSKSRDLIEGSSMHIISFYETEAHPFTNRTIVDSVSSQLGVHQEQLKPLYLNHQDLCRFSGADDPNYRKVCHVIRSECPTQLTMGMKNTSSLGSSYSYDETEKACANLLNSANANEYELKLDVRVEGTLEWLLQDPQYNEWTSSPDVRLIWVTGFAGSGKTILASFLSQHLSHSNLHTLVCKFFCDENFQEYCTLQMLLRNIIFQVVDKRKRHWELVKKACDAGSFKIFDQVDALWNLFIRIVRAEKKYNIAVVIDAIDELSRKDQQRLNTRICGLLSLNDTTTVKVFVTSRPNAESGNGFESCSPHMVRLPLENRKLHIDTDIRSVVHHRLDLMVKRGACRPLVRDSLQELLVAKADQSFLWIKFVLPLLEAHRLLLSSEAESIISTIPATLSSLYRRLLLDIPKKERNIAARVLKLLTICNRPMTGNEIGILATITQDDRSLSSLSTENLLLDQRSVQALLGDLIRTYEGHVELVHLSLKDYLIELKMEEQDDVSSTFGVDIAHDTLTVFRACSMYLSLEEFSLLDPAKDDLVDDDSNSSANSSAYGLDLASYERGLLTEGNMGQSTAAEESAWDLIKAKYLLFDYAALHWATDFTRCENEVTAQDCHRVLSLYENVNQQPLHWFRYFWHEQERREPFPAVVDTLMLAAYFGQIGILSSMLQNPDSGDGDPISRALYWAARQGKESCVNLILKHGLCNPQYSDHKNQTSLSAAAQFGHHTCVSLLVRDSRVDPNAQDNYGRTPLSQAVRYNHHEVCSALLELESIDVNLQDHALNTPLHLAVDTASLATFKKLLAHKSVAIQLINKYGRSILSLAAELGEMERVTCIMDRSSAQIEQVDFKGRTPLSYASQYGHLPVVKRLIEIGHADPLCKDEDGRNAHSWAAISGNPDVLRYLTKKYPEGVDEPDRDGWAPLAWTLDYPGHPSNMQELLRRGHVDVERPGGVHGRTVLSWAANYRNSRLVSILIQVEGINLEARDAFARTPLSEAAENGSLDIVRLLLATGKVDVNSRDKWGQTPLSWAVKGGHLEVVRLLLSTPHIVKESQDEMGETAMDLAERLGHEQIMSELARQL